MKGRTEIVLNYNMILPYWLSDCINYMQTSTVFVYRHQRNEQADKNLYFDSIKNANFQPIFTYSITDGWKIFSTSIIWCVPRDIQISLFPHNYMHHIFNQNIIKCTTGTQHHLNVFVYYLCVHNIYCVIHLE